MPVISTERMRDRRESILAAASRVFSQKGFQAASITEIAQAPVRILFKASPKHQADGGWCSVRQGVPVRVAVKDSRDGV